MAIGPAVASNANTYLTNAENEHGNWPNGAIWTSIPTSGITGGYTLYYERLNRWYLNTDNDPGATMQIDPLLQVFLAPTTDYIDAGVDPTHFLSIGEWNPNTNAQKVYFAQNVGQKQMFEVDVPTFSETADFVPGADSSAQFMGINTGHGIGTPGYKYGSVGNIVFFESWGYYIQLADVEHSDNVRYDDVLIKCELSSGECTLMNSDNTSGFVVTYQDSPNQFQLGRKNGHEFSFEHLQFIPDITDSNYSVANPKGVLFMSTRDVTGNFTGTNLRVAGNARVYVKMVEFNPNTVTAPVGGINRVHGREILFSRYELDESALTSNGIGTNVLYDGQVPFFHPPSNTLIQAFRDLSLNTTRYVSTPVAVVFDSISAPSPLGQVETNRTVTFRTEARGDIGEPIASQDIAWTLKRISSLNEALDTAALGATSTVDNPAISGSTLVVTHAIDGVLTTPTDYTVVEATGVITWAGTHPDIVTGYTATYEHLNTPVAPAHGLLRTTLSSTDSNGLAEARVEYADNSDLVLQKDQIEALPV